MNQLLYIKPKTKAKGKRNSFKISSYKNQIFKPGEGTKKIKKIHNFIRNFFILALICTTIYYFFFSDKFLIENINIEIEGEKSIQEEDILDVLDKFKYKNIFLVDKNAMIKDLEPFLINIAFFDIRRSIPNKLIIKIVEYKEIANLSIELDGIEKKFIMNQNAQVSRENLAEENLPTIYLKSSKQTAENVFTMTKEELQYIINAKSYFEEKFSIIVRYIDYYQIEREIHLMTEKEFSVWLDIDQPYLTQIHALKVAASKLDIFTTPLEYIDLRVSNGQKIIYRRKN